MAMDGISKTNGTQKTAQTKKASAYKKSDTKYEKRQEELAGRIIDPARNVSEN